MKRKMKDFKGRLEEGKIPMQRKGKNKFAFFFFFALKTGQPVH